MTKPAKEKNPHANFTEEITYKKMRERKRKKTPIGEHLRGS